MPLLNIVALDFAYEFQASRELLQSISIQLTFLYVDYGNLKQQIYVVKLEKHITMVSFQLLKQNSFSSIQKQLLASIVVQKRLSKRGSVFSSQIINYHKYCGKYHFVDVCCVVRFYDSDMIQCKNIAPCFPFSSTIFSGGIFLGFSKKKNLDAFLNLSLKFLKRNPLNSKEVSEDIFLKEHRTEHRKESEQEFLTKSL